MSDKHTYKVFTKEYGNFLVPAYSRRHATAAVVARLNLPEADTYKVGGWAVSLCKDTKDKEI